MRPRFSIAALLAVIGFCGVAFAALRAPSYFWANLLFSAALGLLLMAVVGAIYGRGARRAYWLGFAIFGGTYFALCSLPGLRDTVCPRLVSEVAFDLLYAQIAPAEPFGTKSYADLIAAQSNTRWVVTAVTSSGMPTVANAAPSGSWAGPPQPPPTPRSRWAVWNEPDRSHGVGYVIGNVSLVSSEAFRQVGHALVTMLVAVAGGVFARGQHARRAAEASP